MPESAPSVFAYHDYREFMRDWFAHLGKTRKGFSLRSIARESQIAVGYLPMVLSGHRALSKAMLAKILPHLGLGESERAHLEMLRGLAEAESADARTALLAKLQKKRVYQDSHPQEFETFRYMSRWYFVAIRELSAVKGFKLDAKWIQSRLREKVPLADVSEAIEFLIEHGFIQVSAGGKVQFQEKNLQCMGGVYRVALGKFHKEMITLVRDSIESVPSEERHILGHTFAIEEKDLAEVKSVLDEALAKIEAISERKRAAETVYHVTLGVAPLTKKESKE